MIVSGWLADELQLQMKEYDTLRRYGPKDGPAREMTFDEWRDYVYAQEKSKENATPEI